MHKKDHMPKKKIVLMTDDKGDLLICIPKQAEFRLPDFGGKFPPADPPIEFQVCSPNA